jgi:hypothetical protein
MIECLSDGLLRFRHTFTFLKASTAKRNNKASISIRESSCFFRIIMQI